MGQIIDVLPCAPFCMPPRYCRPCRLIPIILTPSGPSAPANAKLRTVVGEKNRALCRQSIRRPANADGRASERGSVQRVTRPDTSLGGGVAVRERVHGTVSRIRLAALKECKRA
jgi:hypothetical protein